MLAVAVLVALAGCLGTVGSPPNDATPALDGGQGVATNAITVSATATASAPADQLVVHVSVVGEGDTARAAARAAAADAEALRDALGRLVDRDGFRVDVALLDAGYRLSPQYDHASGSRTVVGYEVVQSFRVETAAVDSAGALVDAAVDGSASRVDAVAFALTDDLRADLRADALAAAMADARTEADVVAAAADVTVDALAGASTTNVVITPYRWADADGTGVESARTTFEPGDVTVTATVTYTYV